MKMLHNRYIPLEKQSKRAQRAFYAQKRGSWYGVVPVTRTEPSGKKYDRNRRKQKERREAQD